MLDRLPKCATAFVQVPITTGEFDTGPFMDHFGALAFTTYRFEGKTEDEVRYEIMKSFILASEGAKFVFMRVLPEIRPVYENDDFNIVDGSYGPVIGCKGRYRMAVWR